MYNGSTFVLLFTFPAIVIVCYTFFGCLAAKKWSQRYFQKEVDGRKKDENKNEGFRMEDLGKRIKEGGSRIEDQGQRIHDRRSTMVK